MIANDPELFGEKAAARVLQVHPCTIRRWRREGRITFYRSSTGRITYTFADLMAFAMSQRVEPVPAPSEAPLGKAA
ncbi:helix-turn-helix domain-containing protein [Sandarakinorhabdus sp.]|uniref:helix-turn-helix domain-containing protein n=1 Tax=Sandarakinorhabdus sp. TaxID=1916663 RepID=UPI00286DD0EB|nr:helix-turn-helix domain-containing protein [Sandarakinorhabdus sp.]